MVLSCQTKMVFVGFRLAITIISVESQPKSGPARARPAWVLVTAMVSITIIYLLHIVNPQKYKTEDSNKRTLSQRTTGVIGGTSTTELSLVLYQDKQIHE